MDPLDSHVRAAGDHGRLAFHPGCPTCRGERLLGGPANIRLVPLRLQAAAAAAALAMLPTVTATPVLADGGDGEEVGTQDPDSVNTGDPADDPNFRPPKGPKRPDQELGPTVDPDAPTNDGEPNPLEEGSTTPPPPAPPASVPTPGPGAPTPPPVSPPPPPTPSPGPSPAAPLPLQPPAAGHPRDRPRSPAKRTTGTQRTAQPQHGAAPAPARPVSPAAKVAPTGSVPESPDRAPNPPAARAATQRGATKAAQRGRLYTVQAGDSLWSIAARRLGPDSSPAQVAAVVQRLWQLNAETISSGDPDLIVPGQRLRLA